MHSFTVLMPVYNEAEILGEGVRSVVECMESLGAPYELIIVESGSTDGTDAIADALAASNPAIRVIHEGARKGFGSALRVGYAAARMEWVWLITPDLPFPLSALQEAVPLLDRYDAVLSYRADDDRTRFRKFQSVCFNMIVKTAFGLRVTCVNSAFKLLRRSFVQSIDLWSKGWTIDTELIYLMQKSGLRFVEIGVPLQERRGGESKIGAGSAAAVLKDIFRLWSVRETLTVAPAAETAPTYAAEQAKTAAKS